MKMSPEMKKALDKLEEAVREELPQFIRVVIIPWQEERRKLMEKVFGLNEKY